jgi:hypothetical protein
VILERDGTVDVEGTRREREAIRRARLAGAEAAGARVERVEGAVVGMLSLGVEIVDRDGRRHARCARCTQLLATAPASWRGGAARRAHGIECADGERTAHEDGGRRTPAVVMREFFCPGCATALEVEVVVEGVPLEDDALPAGYGIDDGGAAAAAGEPTT